MAQPRPGILDMAPYKGGESRLAGQSRVIKLASNENPLGPSPRAVAAHRALADQLHRYPDGGAEELRQAIAGHHGLPAGQIVCGAGSDELITLLTRGYAGPSDEVLFSQYGFLMYALSAKSVGATPVAAPERAIATDVDALLAKLTPRTRLLFLANPNNPTGSLLPNGEVRRLHAGLPRDVLLVLDSAYAEYVAGDDYRDGAALVRAHDNVVMLRTFSKIYGLAALRIGWAYCPTEVADVLNRLRNPFNVNAPAQAAALAALADRDHVAAGRAHNDRWLPWFRDQLAARGHQVLPSAGNFLLAHFGTECDAVIAHLNRRGIIPRPMAPYGLPEHLRITIGLADELQAVLSALDEFAAERPGARHARSA
jgi:histidinol-phosphate aminotransferase